MLFLSIFRNIDKNYKIQKYIQDNLILFFHLYFFILNYKKYQNLFIFYKHNYL